MSRVDHFRAHREKRHRHVRSRLNQSREHRSSLTHRVDRSLSLVVLLFHKTVDLASVQIRVILRVSLRMPGRRLLRLMRRCYVGRRQASRVRRNGHVHSAIARRQSTPWALQSPAENPPFFRAEIGPRFRFVNV